MAILLSSIASLLLLFTVNPQSADSRTWKAGDGVYPIKGEAIAQNDTTVIIKRDRSQKLVAVEINELSAEDQKYLERKKQQQTQATPDATAGEWQNWTSASGWEIRGRVLAYGRKDLVVSNQSGAVLINGKAYANFDPLHQRVILTTLSNLEGQEFKSETDLRRFVNSLKGQPKSYPLEGVMFQLESGDQIPVPFFLFSEKDQRVLRSGWENWVAAEKDQDAQRREDFLMQQESLQYQAMQRREQQHQQMEVLKLNLLAAGTGVTSIWEVALVPRQGMWGRPTTVVVSARNSQQAAQLALQMYPGFVVGPIRKLSNN